MDSTVMNETFDQSSDRTKTNSKKNDTTTEKT